VNASPIRTAAAGTRLAKAVADASAAAWPGRSGIYPLPIAQEAFAARALLARAAERSLDVQYYIWRLDTTGWMLLEELWNAADRGVRVRLLLDDNGIAGLDATLAALDSHDNMEVRLFNPFAQRRFKPLGYLTDFRRLNRRMHNKSFTADASVTVVGGRNIGDEYFGAGQRMLFADLDVLAVGHIADEVRAAFDQYWDAEAVLPLASVVGRVQPGGVQEMWARFQALRASPEAARYESAVKATRLVEALLAHDLPLEWTRVGLLCDPPSKVSGPTPDVELLLASLREALGEPHEEIDLVSPYFVPGRQGLEALARFAHRDVTLRVLTNSLAATDVGAVHAGYAKRRKPLLRSGVRLYELKPDADAIGNPGADKSVLGSVGSSSASLHAKTFSVDRIRVFVGSLNLDPRSVRLNTEMGLVIESASLADDVASALNWAAECAAYETVLSADGRRLEWLERTGKGAVRHRVEPRTSFLERLGVGAMALLPIEWLL